MLLNSLIVIFSAFFPSLRGFDMELTERVRVPQLQNSDTKRLVSSDAPDHVHLYELTRLFVRSTTPMSREETVQWWTVNELRRSSRWRYCPLGNPHAIRRRAPTDDPSVNFFNCRRQHHRRRQRWETGMVRKCLRCVPQTSNQRAFKNKMN